MGGKASRAGSGSWEGPATGSSTSISPGESLVGQASESMRSSSDSREASPVLGLGASLNKKRLIHYISYLVLLRFSSFRHMRSHFVQKPHDATLRLATFLAMPLPLVIGPEYLTTGACRHRVVQKASD